MLELLIRLHEMRDCCQRANRNPQLTDGEKLTGCAYKQLVRDCLPKEVLAHYDRMKKTERSLRVCPEVFAMAVLVSTYRSLTPEKRRRLVDYFSAAAPQPRSSARSNKPRCLASHRREDAPVARAAGKPWLR